MDPRETVRQIDSRLLSDPNFASLTYEEQKEARALIYDKKLGEVDPQYRSLSPTERQQAAYGIAAKRRPVLENKQNEQLILPAYTSAEKGLLTEDQAKAVSFIHGAFRNNLVLSIVKPFLRMGYKAQEPGDFINELPPEQQQVLRTTSALGKMTMLSGGDADKAYRYIAEQAAKNDPELSRIFSQNYKMGSGFGFAGDVVTFEAGIGAAVSSGTKAMGLAASKNLLGFSAKAVRTAVPQALSSAATGGYGLFREQFLATVNSDSTREQNSFKKVLRTFGDYALLDFAIGWTAGTVLPYMKNLRHFFRKGDTIAANADELDTVIKQVTEGTAPAELIEQLSDVQKHYIYGQADMRKAAMRLDDSVKLRPYDDLLLRANDAQVTVYREPSSNQYFIHKMTDDGKKFVEVKARDIIEAKREVGFALQKRLKEIKDPLAYKDFARRNEQFLNMARSADAIDSAFDPRRHADLIDKDTAKIVRPKGTAKGFVSPADRPYVGANEVEGYRTAFKNSGGYAEVFKTDVTEETLGRLQKGQRIFTPGNAVDVQRTTTGNADVMIMLRNPVWAKNADSLEALKVADELADRAIAEGASDSKAVLRNMYLMEAGYDGIVKNANRVEAFYPDKLKLVADKFDPTTGKIGDLSPLKTPESDLGVRATIAQKFTAEVGGRAIAADEKLFADIAGSFRGTLAPDDVRKFSSLFLENFGVNARNVRIKPSGLDNVTSLGDDVAAYGRIKDGVVTIEVPSRITTPKAQKKFVTELYEELKNAGESLGTGNAALSTTKIGNVVKKSAARFTSPFTDLVSSEKWLKSVVQDTMGGGFSKTARGYEAVLKDGTRIAAANIEEFADRLFVAAMSPAELKFDLARQGFALSEVGNDLIVRGSGLEAPIKATSVPELLDKLNYRPSRISSRFAPKVISINDRMATVAFDQGIAIGGRKEVRKALAKFENMDYMARLKKVAASDMGDIYIRPAGDYEAHITALGEIRRFKNIKEANRYIKYGWKSYDGIADLAHKKGLEMWYDKGIMKFSDGNATYTAKSFDEAQQIFRDFPDSTGTPELFEAFDPEALSPIDRVLYNYDMSDIKNWDDNILRKDVEFSPKDVNPRTRNLTTRQELRALVENMDYWTERTAKELDLPDVLRSYRNVETARRVADTEIEKARRAILGIFTDNNGKLMPLDRRKAIFYHAGAQTAEEAAAAYKIHGALTPGEKATVERLRDLLGRKVNESALSGLAGKFGLPPGDFLYNYMPRVMDYASQNADKVRAMSSADELFDAALKDSKGTKAPPKLKAFFKNLRASEILNFNAMDDPIEAIEHYSRVGHRQLYMGKAWEELYQNLSRPDVPQRMIVRFNRYREQLMGVYTTSGQETAEALGEQMGKRLGFTGGKDLTRAYFSLNYLATMGFRPYLAVRNSTQIWTTLGARFGNEWVSKALNRVSDSGEQYYTYLKRIGVIQDAPPIVNEILDANNLLGKVTKKGLAVFKRSDDLTRAIAYSVGETRFNYALDKYRRGVGGLEDFLKESGVTKMDDDTIRQVKKLMEVGDEESWAAARTMYGTKISEDTMFGYRQSQAPTLYTGSFWGKLFGQYGTYAAGYRANFYRAAFQSGTLADKLGFAARFVGNNAALFAAFRSLGIRENSFIPGSPALFGGGPQFEIGVALAQSMDTTYRGKQARALLMRKFSPIGYSKTGGLKAQYPELLPGSLQIRYAQKALEYAEEGDLYRAFLAATTTPVAD